MSVLIKGMEMPKCCQECPINYVADYSSEGFLRSYCFRNGQWFDTSNCTSNRRDDCPIIELPHHGDLIDRNDLKNKEITFDCDKWEDSFDDGLLFVCELIDNAPTIIEAEGE